MHGNVSEWCWDWYGTYNGGSEIDPTGGVTGSYRVLCGGGWNYNARYARSAFRDYSDPSGGNGDIGWCGRDGRALRGMI